MLSALESMVKRINRRLLVTRLKDTHYLIEFAFENCMRKASAARSFEVSNEMSGTIRALEKSHGLYQRGCP